MRGTDTTDIKTERPWLFKPGVSGNPKGRPPGVKSLKMFAKEYLQSLPDEKKLDYMKGMDKQDIWKMAEGMPKQDSRMELDIPQNVIDLIKNAKASGNPELPGENKE